jgi:hypothetical protein
MAILKEIQDHRENLDDSQFKGLTMIALKVERILTGDANEPDHWLDIAGYANLVRENMAPEPVGSTVKPGPLDVSQVRFGALDRKLKLLAKPPIRDILPDAQIDVAQARGFGQTYTALKRVSIQQAKWATELSRAECLTKVYALTNRYDKLRDQAISSGYKSDLIASALVHFVNREPYPTCATFLYIVDTYSSDELVHHIEEWVLDPDYVPSEQE